MVQPIIKNDYRILKRTFYVRDRNLNEDGTLDVCKILKEIVFLNDQVIVSAYGALDYNSLMTWHYNISFNGEAALYDYIELESRYVVTADNKLSIQLYVSKGSGDRNETIAEGNFVFASRSVKV